MREAFTQIAEDRAYSLRDYFTRSRFSPAGKKQVAPKSAMQRKYIEVIQQLRASRLSAALRRHAH